MKNFEKFLKESQDRTEKLAEVKREMQKELIEKSFDGESDKDGFIVDWISENRQKFADAFDRIIVEDENIVENWSKHKDKYVFHMLEMMNE